MASNSINSTKIKGIVNVIGSLILHILLGILFTWSNIIPYLTSYYRLYSSPNMKVEDGYLIMPLTAFTNTFSSVLGPIIESYIHIKNTVILSLTIMAISNYIFLVSTKIFEIYIAMILLGVATGFCMVPVTKNCLQFFPNNIGFIQGLLLFGYASSGLIFTSLADYVINPMNKKADMATGLFDSVIGNNTFKFIRLYNRISFVLSIVVFFCIRPFKEEKDGKNVKAIENLEKGDNNASNNGQKLIEKEKEVKHPLRQVFKDVKIYQIIALKFFGIVFGLTCGSTYRVFGSYNGISHKLLTWLSKTYSLINGGFRFVWGILFDKYPLKNLLYFVFINQIIVSCTLYYSVQIPYLYFFLVCNTAILMAGNVSLLITVFPKVYGIKYYAYVSSIANLICSLSNLVFPFLSKIIIKEHSDYKYLFLCGTFFTVLCVIILIFYKNEEFKYRGEKKDNEGEMIEKLEV